MASIEVGLKEMAVRPIISGLVHEESFASSITDLFVKTTKQDGILKIVDEMLKKYVSVDLQNTTLPNHTGLDYDVIETYSKRTDTHPRFRATLRWVARLILVSIAGSWLYLYLDSAYQRRRAEAFFADLRSLDFATAGFPVVRDIMIRNGGTAMQRKLLPRAPDPDNPRVDDHGNMTFPRRPQTTCTPRDCWFLLQIMTQLPRIPLIDRKARFFYTTLPYIGVRSWVVGAQFEVRDGKLYMSSTGVWEYRMERVDYNDYRQLVPLGYGVETRRDAASFEYGPCSSQDYQVWVSHGVCVVQSAGVPVKRAFDVHLGCLNNPFRNCRFDELAPSAWADYSAKYGTGTRDPHK
jgi:hypothetical protein